jgi:hypothetical protein
MDQKGDTDEDGYMNPSALGFDVPPGFLKMRLFPFHEIEHDTEYLTNIPNPQDLISTNMKSMPGMILNLSIGSPPLVNVGDKLFRNVHETDPAFLNGKSSVYDWISKYVSGICFNVSTTILSYRSHCMNLLPPPPPPGLNIYIDCTENTVLARDVNVGAMLRILITAPRLFSLIESAVEETKYDAIYHSMISRLISRFDSDLLPMWKVFVMVLYRIVHIAQKIDVSRKTWYKEWDETNPLHDALDIMMDEIERDNSSDYNVRIYLIKRRGRLLHDETERMHAQIPEDYMPAFGLHNISSKMWLAMSQYYRLMSLFQTPFRIKDHDFQTLSSMIFRDAHSSTSSTISAKYDYDFFQYAEMSSEKNIRHKTIMVAAPSEYKLHRHPMMNDNSITLIKPKSKEYYNTPTPLDRNNYTLGVALGVCWFYNSTKEALLDSNAYPILNMPFLDLVDHVDETGQTIKVPRLVDERDRNNFLKTTDEKTFFTYGMDEYIISKFVVNHMFDDSEQFNRVNLLFFNLFWFRNIQKATGNEIDPILRKEFIQTFLDWRGKNPTITSIALRSFYLRKINEDPSYKYILHPMINCMYGNAFSDKYRTINLMEMDVTMHPVEEEDLHRYQSQFGVDSLDVILDTIFRYDRPCYWKMEKGLYSPRILMGKKIIPSNRKAPMLEYVCMNPIESKCMRGVCELDGAAFHNTRYGGKKKSKTRKSKSRRKKCTRKRAVH